jgi:hypothetical protein
MGPSFHEERTDIPAMELLQHCRDTHNSPPVRQRNDVHSLLLELVRQIAPAGDRRPARDQEHPSVSTPAKHLRTCVNTKPAIQHNHVRVVAADQPHVKPGIVRNDGCCPHKDGIVYRPPPVRKATGLLPVDRTHSRGRDESVNRLGQFQVDEGTTMAQFALRWILMHDAVTCAIPGAKRASQVKENVDAAGLPPITDSAMDRVGRIYGRHIRDLVHHYW